MESEKRTFRVHWFWGLLEFLGILGFILEEPLYYTFLHSFYSS